ncbi:MAG: hypothetical protein FWC57_00155 [Endomicrobia bacterium]|nr:hypothetical protein [Endomicrobiia bacterium]
MKKLFFAALFIFLLAGAASAEYFYMKSGEVVEGKIISETMDSVTVSVGGTKTKRKLMFKDIDQMSSKPRPASQAAITSQAGYDEKTAKSQFTSQAKQDMPDSKTYIDENKSGIIVYNVKETENVVVKDMKTPSVSPAQPNGNDDFDAAAYLLGGGQPSDLKPKVAQPAPAAVQPSDNGDFDAAAYLLSGGKPSDIKPGVSAPQPAKPAEAVRPQERQIPVKTDNNDDFSYDPNKYLINDNPQVKKSAPVSQPAVEKNGIQSASSKPPSELFLAASLDLKGAHKFTGSVTNEGVRQSADISESSDYGVSLSAERYGYLSRFAALGIGLGYQFGRCLETSPGRFGFLPVYAAFKMRVLSGEDYHLYGVAHLGYGFIIPNTRYRQGTDSAEGGIYYAAGAGIAYHRFVFQALYSADYAHLTLADSTSYKDINKSVQYSKLGLYFGYLI